MYHHFRPGYSRVVELLSVGDHHCRDVAEDLAQELWITLPAMGSLGEDGHALGMPRGGGGEGPRLRYVGENGNGYGDGDGNDHGRVINGEIRGDGWGNGLCVGMGLGYRNQASGDGSGAPIREDYDVFWDASDVDDERQEEESEDEEDELEFG